MDIFNFIPRSIERETTEEGVIFFINNFGGSSTRLTLCEMYGSLLASLSDSIKRVFNGQTRSLSTTPSIRNPRIEWIDNRDSRDLICKDDYNNIIFRINRTEIANLELDTANTIDFIVEVGIIFLTIIRERMMPIKYRGPIESARVTTTEINKKKDIEMVDDIPENVFTMETIIDRIRNCGSIANPKEVPVIIRFNDKKLMITDTSVEDGFLYLDVIEVQKKKIEKPSIKFSDYITLEDIGTRQTDWSTIRTYFDNNLMNSIITSGSF